MLLRTSAILLVALANATLHAQSAPATSLTFEVASLRPASPDHYEPGNLDLDPSDYNRYQGGPIIASGPLVS